MLTVALVKKLILKYIGGAPLKQARTVKADFQKVAHVASDFLGEIRATINQVMGTINQLRSYVAMAQTIMNNPMGAIAGLVSTELNKWSSGALDGLSSHVGGAGVLDQIKSAVHSAVSAYNSVQKVVGDVRQEIDSVVSTVNSVRNQFLGVVAGIDGTLREFGGLLGDVTGKLVTMPTLNELLGLENRYTELTGNPYPGLAALVAPMLQAQTGQALVDSLSTAEARLTAGTITPEAFIAELNAHRDLFIAVQCDAIRAYNDLASAVAALDHEYETDIDPVISTYNALLDNPTSTIVTSMVSGGVYHPDVLNSILPVITDSETSMF